MQIQFADLWFGLQRIDSVSAREGLILALLVEIRVKVYLNRGPSSVLYFVHLLSTESTYSTID